MAMRAGRLIAVVGPSGAGKDSVIRGAMAHFAGEPSVVFPRRVVTRKADAAAEDHDSLSEMAFALAVAKGDFALWWEAHGNAYGVPASIDADLAEGRTVVFNCSRSSLAEVAERYPRLAVAEIAAPADVLVERIVARGRELPDAALKRVSRAVPPSPAGIEVRRIDNGGALADAVAALCRLIAGSEDAGSHPGRSALDEEHKREDGDDRRRGLVVIE